VQKISSDLEALEIGEHGTTVQQLHLGLKSARLATKRARVFKAK
jgi:hypothetical protein